LSNNSLHVPAFSTSSLSQTIRSVIADSGEQEGMILLNRECYKVGEARHDLAVFVQRWRAGVGYAAVSFCKLMHPLLTSQSMVKANLNIFVCGLNKQFQEAKPRSPHG